MASFQWWDQCKPPTRTFLFPSELCGRWNPVKQLSRASGLFIHAFRASLAMSLKLNIWNYRLNITDLKSRSIRVINSLGPGVNNGKWGETPSKLGNKQFPANYFIPNSWSLKFHPYWQTSWWTEKKKDVSCISYSVRYWHVGINKIVGYE